MAYRLLLPEAWDSSPDGVSSWQAALLGATTIITGGVLMPTATGGLTELVLGAESHGNSQLRGLVPTALSSLDTALEDTAAGGSSATTSAVRALQLAAFVADAMLAAGCDAGLAPALGTIGATRAALQAPRQDTGEAEREQLQLRLLLQSHAQVPALLAAVDAVLQRGVLNAAGGAYSEARCQLALLRIGCFVSWLGIAGIQAPGSLLSLQPGAVASCAAAAWLPVLRHSLQLHAAYSGSEAADGFASNLGPFMERLAQGSRGLAATHFRAALLMPRGRGEQSQERLAAGAGAGAGRLQRRGLMRHCSLAPSCPPSTSLRQPRAFWPSWQPRHGRCRASAAGASCCAGGTASCVRRGLWSSWSRFRRACTAC